MLSPESVSGAATASAVAAFGVTKRFPGVIANNDVSVDIRVGEVHALLGENGAGKTTLSNIFTGLYRPDEGFITVGGEPKVFTTPKDAIDCGIGMVHQHFRLIPNFTVAENIVCGLQDVRGRLPMRQIEEEIAALADQVGMPVNPRARIWQLSVGEQQRVEILKVLRRNATILIMDEPTAVLTPNEADGLMDNLRTMVSNGRSVIFISHKLGEVLRVADRVSVLRDGKCVSTVDSSSVNRRELASLMVGREVESVQRSGSGPLPGAATVLTVSNLSADGDRGLAAVDDVSFTVKAGEILGIAGVAGNGQRELVEVLAGLRERSNGVIDVDGEKMDRVDARYPIRMGVAYIPQDRLGTGLAPDLSIAENLILKRYRRPPVSRPPFLRTQVIADEAEVLMSQFDVRAPSAQTPTRRLSGGNVQKVLLAREMSGSPKVLVVSTPTQGLDVGAVATVHQLLSDAAERGVGIVLVSEDLDEIFALSDRIAVMYEGRILSTMARHEASIEQVGMLMGGSVGAA